MPGRKTVCLAGKLLGWTGIIADFGLGLDRLRLKFVVLPLNALMLKVSFASGEAEAAKEEGFKDIL